MSVDLNVPLASILDYIQNDMLCTIFFSLEMACIIAIIQQSNCNCVIYRTEYQQNPLKNTYGQPPTNSLHGLPVASCHKNNNSGQSFDTGVCRKSKKPPVGVHTATTFCCFSLSIMRFTQYL